MPRKPTHDGIAAPVADASITALPPIKRDHAGRVTTTDAADLLGYTDKTLRNWRRAKPVPCHAVEEGGLVDTAGVVRWLLERQKAELELANAASVDGLTLEEVQVRHEIVKTRKSENAVAAEDGKLIERGLYEHVVSVLLSQAVGRLYAIGAQVMDAVAAEDDPIRCRKLIDDQVDTILARLTLENAMNPASIENDGDMPGDEQKPEEAEPAKPQRKRSAGRSKAKR